MSLKQLSKTAKLSKEDVGVLQNILDTFGDSGIKAIKNLIKEEMKFSNKILDWYRGNDTGISSEAIMTVMTGKKWSSDFTPDVPRDPSDFGRCYRLLKSFPEFKERLPEVAKKYPEWEPFVQNWDRLTSLYEKDQPRQSSEMYRLMHGLRNDSEPDKFNVFLVNQKNGLREMYSSEMSQEIIQEIKKLKSVHPLGTIDSKGLACVLLHKKDFDQMEAPPSGAVGNTNSFSGTNGMARLIQPGLDRPKESEKKFMVMVAPYPIEFNVGSQTISIKNSFEAGVKEKQQKIEPGFEI